MQRPTQTHTCREANGGWDECVSRCARSVGRGKVKDLGETLDSGSLAIIVVAPNESADSITATLGGAKTVKTAASATTEEIQEALAHT